MCFVDSDDVGLHHCHRLENLLQQLVPPALRFLRSLLVFFHLLLAFFHAPLALLHTPLRCLHFRSQHRCDLGEFFQSPYSLLHIFSSIDIPAS